MEAFSLRCLSGMEEIENHDSLVKIHPIEENPLDTQDVVLSC